MLHKSGNFRYSGANGTKFSENEFYGLKIGAIHRNRFAARVLELLEMAALPDLSAAIEPLLRVREGMCTERKALDRTLAAAFCPALGHPAASGPMVPMVMGCDQLVGHLLLLRR